MTDQRTEYRDDTTGELLATVHEQVNGHRAGELVFLPERGRSYITAVEPPFIQRINNSGADCVAIHVIRVR